MTIWQARHLFDFQWSNDRRLKRRQKKVVRQALALPLRWRKMRATLPEGQRIVVKWGTLPNGTAGQYLPDNPTILLRIDDITWSLEWSLEVLVHELLHAFDMLALTTETRDDLFAVLHDGGRPDGHIDIGKAWGWLVRGEVPYHVTPEGGSHHWFDGSYREGIGEAFAEVGMAAFLGAYGMPYEHGAATPSDLLKVLGDKGYLHAS